MPKFKANNLILGLAKKDLQIGDTVQLEEAAAALFVATGSLSPVAEAAPPAPPPAPPPAK